jgi:KDO2-lipid IV(A) lauroyltransferase
LTAAEALAIRRQRPRAEELAGAMEFAKRAQQWAEYAGFLLLAAIIRALPLETASRLSGAGWRLIAPYLSRQKRALANLAIAFPDMPLGERQRIAAAMWENLGRTYAEFFHIQRIVAEGRIAFEPFEKFHAITHGGPFVVCGLHLGNWEITSQAGKLFGIPITGVYQKLSNPLVDEELVKLRTPQYEGGLYAKDAQTARTLLRIARGDGYSAFLADLRDDRGVSVPFFGRPAWSTNFPAMLACTVGLPLYACAVYRLPNVRFSMRIERIDVPKTGARDADALVATAALQKQFEAFIRAAPEQWMWGHRRWD